MTSALHGLPIRIASKSLRCRTHGSGTRRGAAGSASASAAPGPHDGFRGVLAVLAREALWLARHGHADVVVGYPTVDLAALTELGQDPSWPPPSP